MSGSGPRHLTRRLAAVAAAVVLVLLAGCSLISLKTPERPLSPRDLNARILTHEYSGRFIAGVAEAADEISTTTDSAAARAAALHWKISASVASETAATGMAPYLSLLDTWALAAQMADFLGEGAGRDLFGAQQAVARVRASELATEAEALVRRLSSADEFERARIVVNHYVRSFPLTSVAFARPSVAQLWAESGGPKALLVESLGTVPESLTNLGDVVRIYGSNGSAQLVWNAQLAAEESGVSPKDLEGALRRLDERIAQLAALAESSPQRLNALLDELRSGLGRSLAELNRGVHAEQNDFFEKLNAQRDAAFAEINTQRAAIAADASRIATESLRTAGEEARQLVRDTLLLVGLLVLLVLGLPFAAGYWLGRARARG